MDYLHRTWTAIHLDRLNFNIARVQERLPSGTKLMGVVKADAYGHGDLPVARELISRGVDFLAVSNLEEALRLRFGGISCGILILGYTPVSRAHDLFEQNITQAVFSSEYADALNQACVNQGILLSVHIKIDTGMSRIGFPQTQTQDASEEAERVCRLPGLNADGIFTHFSSADMPDPASSAYTAMQEERFRQVVASLKEKGLSFGCVHIQNSAGIAWRSAAGCSYARGGILLYGYPPGADPVPFDIQPVMELKSVIHMIKELDAGTAVSYGRTYTTGERMKIATLPLGYADGYSRLLSNRGEMLVRGVRVPIVGNICMDQLMLDVSRVEGVQPGDIVTAVGEDGGERISFSELSEKMGTIPYELMCSISKRVPRVYLRDGKVVEVIDYML